MCDALLLFPHLSDDASFPAGMRRIDLTCLILSPVLVRPHPLGLPPDRNPKRCFLSLLLLASATRALLDQGMSDSMQ